jgi:hypothetical protein
MNRNKKKSTKVKKAIDATFSYTSDCCKVPGKKPPVERSAEDKENNEFSQSGLGTWRCSKCAKKCKVTRGKAKESDGHESSGDTDSGTQAEAAA